jgi:hypothetical protein
MPAKETPIEANMPHRISEVICLNCGHRQMSVRPVGVKLKMLECGHCRQQGSIIETGEILEE